jgi:hypothetical protein
MMKWSPESTPGWSCRSAWKSTRDGTPGCGRGVGRAKWAVAKSRICKTSNSSGRTRTSNPPILMSSSRSSSSRVCDSTRTEGLPQELARRIAANRQSAMSKSRSYNMTGKTMAPINLCARCQLAALASTYLVPFRRSCMKYWSDSRAESRRIGVIGAGWRRAGARAWIDALFARLILRSRLRIAVAGFITVFSLTSDPYTELGRPPQGWVEERLANVSRTAQGVACLQGRPF